MKKICFLLVVLGLVGCDQTGKKMRQVETSLTPPVRIEGDTLWSIEDRMKHYGVPGVSLAVIYNGKIAWTKAYGVMHKERKEPVTTTTLFQAGSISKPVAAYGALRIVAAGKINPEENVNTYLTTWKLPENEFTRKQPVHLKHLLTHTGGVTVHGFLGYSPDLPVPTLVQVLNGEPPANSPPIRVDKLPGEGFRYSGGGYSIMQQMLIDVEGKQFPQVMDELVHGPLGMKNSSYEQPLAPEKLKLAAAGYLPNGDMTKGERHTYPEMAAAGLWTTAEDLALFALDIQRSWKGEPGAILGQEIAKLMLTPYIVDDQGLGPGLSNFGGEQYFGHGGWDEGFSSEMIAHRDKGYGVVVLTNSNHPPFIGELMRAVALTYNWDNFVPMHKPVPQVAGDEEKVVGRYRYDANEVATVYSKDGRLYFKYLESPPMALFKVSDSTYARRERTALMQVITNPADQQSYLIFSTTEPEARYSRPRMSEGDKVPHEWFLEKNYKQALVAYQEFVRNNPADEIINEQALNGRGYGLLFDNKFLEAKEMFWINMMLYPKSANTYDSYAEACMKNGDTDEAITYYRKSLKMNPENPTAVKNLKTLQGK